MTRPNESPAFPHLAVWMAAAGGILGALLALPLLSFPFGVDQGIFSTAADTLRRGGVLYRDAWDNKPPGIFLVYYAAFLTIGRHLWAVRLFEILAIASTSAGLARIGVVRFGSAVTGLIAAAAFPCLYLYILPPGTAHTEVFQMPFLIWSFAVWPRAEDRTAVDLRCFFSGLLLSLGCCFKTPAAVFGIFLLGERLYLDRHQGGRLPRFRATLATAAGLVLPPLAFLTYYASRGAWPEALDAWIFFPARYAAMRSDRAWPDRMRICWSILVCSLSTWGLVLLLLNAIRAWGRRPGEWCRWGVLTAAAFWIVFIQGKFFDYHHVVLFPFLALGLGLGFLGPRPGSPPESATRAWAFTAILGVILLSTAISIGNRLKGVWANAGSVADIQMPEQRNLPVMGYAGDRALAMAVRERTGPDEPLFIWGTRPLIYYLSERPVAGPYTHMIHMAPPWAPQDHRLDRLLARLDREKPRLIIVCSRDWEWWCDQTVGQILEGFPDVREFIHDHYVRTDLLHDCEIWTRK